MIYNNSANDLYTIKVYSLELKKRYNIIVIGKYKYIFTFYVYKIVVS